MSLTDNLLPCPFCGGEAFLASGDDSWKWPECGDCGATARMGATRDDLASRITSWNTRAAPPLPEGAPAAAPAPGALSEAQRRAIGIARGHMLAEPEQWAGILDRVAPAGRMDAVTLDEIRAAAERCLTGHIGTADAVALATFVRDLLSCGNGKYAEPLRREGRPPSVSLFLLDAEIILRTYNARVIAADLLRAAESADGEVG